MKDFMRSTLIGGVIFLLPFVILVAFLAKAFQMMKLIAVPLDNLIPIESIGGIAFVNIMAFAVLVLICFLAGLFARSSYGKKMFMLLDAKLMMIPGYSFAKSITGSFNKEEEEKLMKPVIAKFDDSTQIGFEVERYENGVVAVYLPGAPNPWSGTIAFMGEDRIEPLDYEFTDVISVIRKLGRTSHDMVSKTALYE